jgi:hypothetical protein
MDLEHIIRVFNIITAHFTFLSVAHQLFSKIDHILGHKANLKAQKIEIIHCILWDYNGIKLEINSKENLKSYSN